MTIPTDPYMLLSFVNMKLRDQYDSLEALCEDLDVSKESLDAVLCPAGFKYSEEQKKYW